MRLGLRGPHSERSALELNHEGHRERKQAAEIAETDQANREQGAGLRKKPQSFFPGWSTPPWPSSKADDQQDRVDSGQPYRLMKQDHFGAPPNHHPM